jgi:hypothetical protein
LFKYEVVVGKGYKFDEQPEVEIDNMYEFVMQRVR